MIVNFRGISNFEIEGIPDDSAQSIAITYNKNKRKAQNTAYLVRRVCREFSLAISDIRVYIQHFPAVISRKETGEQSLPVTRGDCVYSF